uniref:Phospholipase/carboxylesterase/thioesterase domain-containing protein n=1 Tax=Pseudo-nitzschia delicatissima TaxID=44447 RepID=A0A7S0UL85_9STRA|mmetsp:Transcript_4740/g.9837  ORF Transcript_4740/g.9837 Transcript_4740/m.9837 type:complete len:414 (+) Transcript_4740:62-1303(+)
MMLSLNRSLFFLSCVCLNGVHRLVAAEEVKDGVCSFAPDILTGAFGKSIPQTCIDVPLTEDGAETVERCFYSYVPESCSAEEITKAPLVLDVHGMGSCALGSASYTGWMQQAEEECMVVVWPSGTENPLIGGCFIVPGFLESEDILPTEGSEVDLATLPCCCLADNMQPETEGIDPLFLKMAIDDVVKAFEQNDDLSIDTDRIYMAGHSNGCMMSLAMAALYSDTIAAVCCHSGSIITPFPEDYSPVPIWMLHGMADTTIPYDGVQAMTIPGIGALGFLSIDQQISYLTQKNGCEGEGEMDVVDETGAQVGKVFKRGQCKDNANVEVVALFDADHHPYQRSKASKSPPTVDTTAMAWEFCSAYSKAAPETSAPEPVVDVEPETEDAEESSAPTSKSFSVVLALALFLGVIGAV